MFYIGKKVQPLLPCHRHLPMMSRMNIIDGVISEQPLYMQRSLQTESLKVAKERKIGNERSCNSVQMKTYAVVSKAK